MGPPTTSAPQAPTTKSSAAEDTDELVHTAIIRLSGWKI